MQLRRLTTERFPRRDAAPAYPLPADQFSRRPVDPCSLRACRSRPAATAPAATAPARAPASTPIAAAPALMTRSKKPRLAPQDQHDVRDPQDPGLHPTSHGAQSGNPEAGGAEWARPGGAEGHSDAEHLNSARQHDSSASAIAALSQQLNGGSRQVMDLQAAWVQHNRAAPSSSAADRDPRGCPKLVVPSPAPKGPSKSSRQTNKWSIQNMTVSTSPETFTVNAEENAALLGSENPDKDVDELEDQPMSTRLHDMANSGGTMDDLVSLSSDVFSSQVNAIVTGTQTSITKHVADAPNHVLPEAIQVLATQIRADQEDEASIRASDTIRLEAVGALSRKQSIAESEDSRRDQLRLALHEGECSQPVAYGSVWSSPDELKFGVRNGSNAGLRKMPGLSTKCKQYVCISNQVVRQKQQSKDKRDDQKNDDPEEEPDGDEQPIAVSPSASVSAPSTSTAEFFGAGVCKCFIQVQEMKMEQFRAGTYHRSKFTRKVYGEPGFVKDQTSGKLITRNPLPDMKHWRPDIHDKKVVWICTLHMDHTCFILPPPDLSHQGASLSMVDDQFPCAASNAPSSSVVPSSAGALAKSGGFGRKYTSSMHTSLLAHKFERAGRTWGVKTVLQEMQVLDPAAKMGMASKVIRNLRSTSILTPEFNVSLLHGLATNLSSQGFGVVFHLVNASTVANMIEDIARKRYTAVCKKNGTATTIRFPST